jgi:hypothetical protein
VKLETLTDNFNSGVLNNNLWIPRDPWAGTPQAEVVVRNQRLEITSDSSSDNNVASAQYYDLTDSYIQVQFGPGDFTAVPTLITYPLIVQEVPSVSGRDLAFYFTVSRIDPRTGSPWTSITFGSPGDVAVSAWVDSLTFTGFQSNFKYDATGASNGGYPTAWFRIHDLQNVPDTGPGVVFWDMSGDGVDWWNFNVTGPLDGVNFVDPMMASFEVQTYNRETNQTVSWWDNVNLNPNLVNLNTQDPYGISVVRGCLCVKFAPVPLAQHLVLANPTMDPILLGANGYADDVFTTRLVSGTN